MKTPVNCLRRWRLLLIGLLLGPLALPLVCRAEDYIGLVYAEREATLSLGQGGLVAAVNVKPGQQVKANQVLLVLDDRMQTLEAERRKVVYDDNSELKANEERVRMLKEMVDTTRMVYEKTGSISRDEMSKLEIEYATARGRLDQLRAQKNREHVEYEAALRELRMRRLTAPIAGVITKVDPKIGEWAKPGEGLVQLVDASHCFLKVFVPLPSVRGLRAGMPLDIRLDGGATTVSGKVSFVSTAADPASGLVEVRVAFANPGLRVHPGMQGVIALATSRAAP